jgi:hypothetical protein
MPNRPPDQSKPWNCRCSDCLATRPDVGCWFKTQKTLTKHYTRERERLLQGPATGSRASSTSNSVSDLRNLLDYEATEYAAASDEDISMDDAPEHIAAPQAPVVNPAASEATPLQTVPSPHSSLFATSYPDSLPTLPADSTPLYPSLPTIAHAPNPSVSTEGSVNSEQIPLDHLRYAHQFIEALKTSTLEDGGLRAEDVHRLCHPEQQPLILDNPDISFSLELFMSMSGSSQQTYRDAREAVLRCHPNNKVLSYEECEKELARLTGIHPTEYDMCINSCAAFVGPWKDLESCIQCNEPRYNATKSHAKGKPVARQRLIHTPPALQLQALYRSPDASLAAQYRTQETEKVINSLGPDGIPDNFEDIMHGQAYLQAVRDGKIGPDDIVLASAMDGAQLYASKESDCWFLIWIVFNLGPDKRYKKKYLIVDTIIPGKNKPVHMYSFMYVTLQNIAAVMRMNNGAGMPIWRAAEKQLLYSNIFMAFNLADAPGMSTVNGLVGHQGARGCRLFCDFIGRRKPGSGTYYPALLCPHNYSVSGCDHNHINPADIKVASADEYCAALTRIERCRTQGEYERVRKETGISKRSIFNGLPSQNILGIPGMFPLDLMHILCLNLAELLIDLWHGTIPCDDSDSKELWDWCVLLGDTWAEHGEHVARCRCRIPGSHDCAPRNIAEKINSGYKAKEHQTHLYVLCPGLLYNVLPFKYWSHFCKLVRAVRILHQKSIKRIHLDLAHRLLLEFVVEFEVLYVQFRTDRLHFIRPCMHTLVHMVPETYRVGPLSLISQWTMERAIGILTQQIRQDSNPYMNISFQALRMTQGNALKILTPEIDAEAC